MPKSIFTKDQDAHLLSYLPTLQAFVATHDPGLDGKNQKVTEWKKQTVAEVMEHDLFKGKLDTTKRSLAYWETSLVRWFTNKCNYDLKLKPAKLALKAAAKSSPSSSGVTSRAPATLASAAAAVSAAAAASKTTDKAADRVETQLQRALHQFASFSSELSPLSLFAFENDKELTEKYLAYSKEHGTPGGGSRNHVLKEMWEAADQKYWEERAAQMLNDIEANQEQFAFVMKLALDGLAERGRIGSSVFNFYYAYRDKNDSLHSGVVYTGYDVETKSFLSCGPPDEKDLQDGWADHANRVLPSENTPKSSGVALDHDDNHLPLFPKVSLRNTSAAALEGILNQYLLELWEYAVTTSSDSDEQYTTAQIPWNELENYPHHFYDSTQFQLPMPIKPVSGYTPVEVLTLATYFRQQRRLKSHFKFQLDPTRPLLKPSSSPLTTPSSSPVKRLPTVLSTAASLPTTPRQHPHDGATPVATPAPVNAASRNQESEEPPATNVTNTSSSSTPVILPTVGAPPNEQATSSEASPVATTPPLVDTNAGTSGVDIPGAAKSTKSGHRKGGAAKKPKQGTTSTKKKVVKRPQEPAPTISAVDEGPLAGKRKRKQVDFGGPKPVVDPSQPPAKKVKHSYTYEPVIV